MATFQITCCSTADLAKEHFARRDIEWVPFHFVMDDKSYDDDLGQSMPYDEFYARIDSGSMPTTSQVNVNEFTEFFQKFLEQGQDILHVSLSTGLSGAYGSACIARDDLLETYPDRKILLLDSLGASSGYGLIMETLADFQDEGKDMDWIYNWIEKNRLKLHHLFFSTDLSHYKRGGRISASAAVVGGLLNICPLMDMNTEGLLTPRRKIQGKKKVIKEIVNQMEAHVQDGLAYSGKCFISNSACMDDAREVARQVEERFPKLNGKVCINSVGAVIGAHTGPGTVALFFWGDERLE